MRRSTVLILPLQYGFPAWMDCSGPNVIKLFLPVNYGFLSQARVFVLGKLFFKSSLKNTSLVRKSVNHGQKSFITLAKFLTKLPSFFQGYGCLNNSAMLPFQSESTWDGIHKPSFDNLTIIFKIGLPM
jgi:hypothetical protein